MITSEFLDLCTIKTLNSNKVAIDIFYQVLAVSEKIENVHVSRRIQKVGDFKSENVQRTLKNDINSFNAVTSSRDISIKKRKIENEILSFFLEIFAEIIKFEKTDQIFAEDLLIFVNDIIEILKDQNEARDILKRLLPIRSSVNVKIYELMVIILEQASQ